MTKQASSPPTSDKGTPTAPPPPPAWRHYLWLIAFVVFFALFFVLPATESKQVTLNYSQFLNDVSAHKVKTVTIATNGSASGHPQGRQGLHHGHPAPGRPGVSQRAAQKVQITARDQRHLLRRRGADLADPAAALHRHRLPLVAPLEGGGGRAACRGRSGWGASKAKVFDEERPKTTFADVAGYEGPSSRYARSSTSSSTPSAMPGPGPWHPGAS